MRPPPLLPLPGRGLRSLRTPPVPTMTAPACGLYISSFSSWRNSVSDRPRRFQSSKNTGNSTNSRVLCNPPPTHITPYSIGCFNGRLVFLFFMAENAAKRAWACAYNVAYMTQSAGLVAYAGIDASVSNSGESESTHNQMSKRGSPYLRNALYQGATVAAFNDPARAAFYQKKRSEGKHRLLIVGLSMQAVFMYTVILKYRAPT